MTQLPDYTVINDETCENRNVLIVPAKTLKFPLSEEDQNDVKILEAKYDQEENCAGLAAPQIGIGKRAIVFEVHDDPELKKWRPDLTDSMPKTIWINPSYEPLSEETHTDYEGCFSVNDLAGPVARFKSIRYEGYTPEGQKMEGVAHGFLARVIQHEVDHTNGICFIHRVEDGKLMSIEAYRAMRAKAMEEGRND
ncbi:peptide deformylase [Candidatus Bealeia paramacronuclearis]